jgi:hypothetical protein
MAFLLMVLGVAGFSYGRLTAPAGRLDFGLRAVDEKGKMLILWDRQAQPAVEAQKATIEIAEGGTRVSINLDRQGVRRGNASYIRRSGRVDLRMRIYRAHDDVEHRVTFLGEAP